MTKKGGYQSYWTAEELRWLKDNAGRMNRRDLQLHLKRSKTSIETMASRLGISLRYYPVTTVQCPICGQRRRSIGKDGQCRVCSVKARLAQAEADTAEAMKQLKPEDRAIYKATETRLQSEPFTRPIKPETDGMSLYQSRKAMEAYWLALDDWEYGTTNRVLRARQRRVERMREKISNY